MSVNGTLVDDKMCTFTLESTHFIFRFPIYTHDDGASAKFSTNSHETDYSVCVYFFRNLRTHQISFLFFILVCALLNLGIFTSMDIQDRPIIVARSLKGLSHKIPA